jgi:phosphoserine phosphatase RsbU/P
MADLLPAEMTVHGPEGDLRTVRLVESPFVVGRSESVHLSLPEDTMLSRQHLAFEWTGSGWQVRDLGSKNGTSVNGVSLVREKALTPGDKIVAGRLVLEYEKGKAPLPRPSGPVEFVDDGGIAVKPDATVILRLDSARVSGVSSGVTAAAAERTQKRMDALVRAGRELASFQPLEDLFRVTLEVALDSVGAARGVLLVAEGGDLVAKAHQGEGFQVSSVVRDKVMREKASVLVRDTEMDALMRGSKTIAQQLTRSLMAVPLQTETQVIGILYVDSPGVVRPFDADDLSLLTVFANIAAIRIEHARLLEVEQAERMMARELEQAADIQKGLFPASPPVVPGWDLAGRSLPCHSVGGDYFDYLTLPDGRLLVVVADVSGKGLAASLLMSSLQARVQALAELETDVARLVGRLNRSLRANTPENKFITGFFAALDPA